MAPDGGPWTCRTDGVSRAGHSNHSRRRGTASATQRMDACFIWPLSPGPSRGQLSVRVTAL